MIGTKELALMKKSAFLLNVARAPIVDREGLFVALEENRIAGAAFDVFWQEPPSSEDKLLRLENFLLTPHIAGWTKESVEAIAEVITSNVLRISQGSSPPQSSTLNYFADNENTTRNAVNLPGSPPSYHISFFVALGLST